MTYTKTVNLKVIGFMKSNMRKNVRDYLERYRFSLLILVTGFILIQTPWIMNTCPYDSLQKAVAQFPTTNNFLLYEDELSGIKVKYPSNWEKIKGYTDNIVIFRAPVDNALGNSIPGVGIYKHDLNYTNIPLNEYNDIQISILKKNQFNIIESTETTLSGLPAHKAVYTDPSQGITALQVWTIKNSIFGDQVYTIIYQANSKQYKDYLKSAEGIVNSFKVS